LRNSAFGGQVELTLVRVVKPAVDLGHVLLRLPREQFEVALRLFAENALRRFIMIALEPGAGTQQPFVGDAESVDKREQL